MAPPKQVDVVIQTQSQVYQQRVNSGTPPSITMNGKPVPSPKGPNSCSGFQLLVLDASKDMTDPATVISNQFALLDSVANYGWMWSNLHLQLLNAGNIEQQLVILASFGMDANAAPSNDMYEQLMNYGAGPAVQQWETHVDRGSQSGSFVAFPACYALIGFSDRGYGQGYELYSPPSGQQSSSLTLAQTLSNPG
jgi:hypothetical protein